MLFGPPLHSLNLIKPAAVIVFPMYYLISLHDGRANDYDVLLLSIQLPSKSSHSL